MNYAEFKAFYEKHGYCISDISFSQKTLNEKQLIRKFNKYVKSLTRKGAKVDILWRDVRKEVFDRDNSECQLTNKLTEASRQMLRHNAGHLFYIIDPAHVIRRTKSAKLKYDPDNVVCLNRYSHSMLDNHKSPITGERISDDEVDLWWSIIVGAERFKRLKENS